MGNTRASLTLMEPLRGLLSDEPRERWQAADLDLWLDGRKLSPKQPILPPRAARAFRFEDSKHWNTRALSHHIRQSWHRAGDLLRDNRLEDWVRRSLGDAERADIVARIMAGVTVGESDARDAAFLAMALDPRAPVTYKGLSISIDSIGRTLAILYPDPDRRAAIGEMLRRRIPNFWLDAQPAGRPELLGYKKTLETISGFLTHDEPGLGLDRCLYELNSDWPCQSPLLKGKIVRRAEEILPALDALVPTLGEDGEPMDAHIAAFCAARLRKVPVRLLRALADQGSDSKRRLAMLAILADVQRDHGPAQVPALAAHFGRLLTPALDGFHNRPYRTRVAAAIDEWAERGDLATLLRLLENTEGVARDRLGFTQAKALYQRAEREINWLEGGGLTAPRQVARGSQQAAAMVSSILSGLSLIGLTLFYMI